MRLHRLEISAFGPYPGDEVVDLDALSSHGVFLLTGPTGAGKTSVLDAVCYALYGAVPGARDGARRVRSDHADPGVRTRVRLELTIGGRRLRVTREPEQERPKRRGTGMTTEKARALLEVREAEEWTAISSRIDEVAHELDVLIGMSREQFCQVVLLPQGDFAAFLSADAAKRGDLLQRLFATERFEKVEQRLASWRVEAGRSRDEAIGRVVEVAARFAEAAGVDERPDVDEAAVRAWADELVDVADKRVIGAEEQAAAARALKRRLTLRHDRARDLADRQQRYAVALSRRGVLDAERPDVVLAEAELAAALRAARVAPLLAAASEAAAAEAYARASLTDLRADLDGSPDPGPELAVLPVATLTSRATALRAELGALEALRAVEDSVVARADEARRNRTVAAEASDRAAAHETWIDEHDTRRADDIARLAGLQSAAALVHSARDRLVAVADRLAAAHVRDRLVAERVACRESLAATVDRAQAARERWFDLREQRINGMAGELAADLLPGSPCPVCGSCDHPSAAPSGHALVTSEAESDAEAEFGVADEERRTAEQALADLDASLAEARALAGGEDDVATHTQALAAARAELAAAEEAAGALSALEAEIARGDAERGQREEERVLLLTRAQAAETAAVAAEREAAAEQARLAQARGGDSSVAARIGRLSALVTLAEAIIGAERDVASVAAEANRARERAEHTARAEGFADVDDAADAARDATRTVELERLVTTFAEHEAAVRAALDDPGLATAAAAPPADVTEALVELEECESGLRALEGELAVARRSLADVARLRDTLEDGLTELRPLAERYAVVAELSRLTDGSGVDNELRMRLSSYVLAARLEEVAAAATVRLQRMSAGRYSLVHTDERDSHNRRSGLGLAVVDAWTGRQRPTSTLSGGESFFTSLALALGLADVVAGEAGGTRLETLFIDEGFGSLDEDTLDEVMSVIDGLREGGRSVGIVSHVAELRQRVPVQLCVEKGPHGSRLTSAG